MVFAQLGDEAADLTDLVGIEAIGWLVEDEEARPVDKGVRESEPLTGKAPKRPEAMFAAPKPISSRLPSTSYRFLAPKLSRRDDAAAAVGGRGAAPCPGV